MRLLIHGGKGVERCNLVHMALDHIHSRCHISLIIHGESPPLRAAADGWARLHGVNLLRYPANWSLQGPDSEARWISMMLRDSKPDTILQLPCDRREVALHRAAEALSIPIIVVKSTAEGRLSGYRVIKGRGRKDNPADFGFKDDRLS